MASQPTLPDLIIRVASQTYRTLTLRGFFEDELNEPIPQSHKAFISHQMLVMDKIAEKWGQISSLLTGTPIAEGSTRQSVLHELERHLTDAARSLSAQDMDDQKEVLHCVRGHFYIATASNENQKPLNHERQLTYSPWNPHEEPVKA